MIGWLRRRRRTQDDPRPSAAELIDAHTRRAPGTPTSAPAPGAPPPTAWAVPAPPTVATIGGDEPDPSRRVLDELRGFFGGGARRDAEPHAAAAPATQRTSNGVAESDTAPAGPGAPVIAPADEAIPGDGTGASPTMVLEQHPAALEPAPTKHSRRRSKREARREARRERKRRKAHDRLDAGPGATTAGPGGATTASERVGVRIVAAPPAPLQSPGSPPSTGEPSVDPPQVEPAPVEPPRLDPLIAAAPPAETPSDALPDGVEPAAARPTITIVDDPGLVDAAYLDAATGEPVTLGAPERIFIDDDVAHPGGEFLPIDLATSAGRIEPRLRERRAAVKKESRLRRLRWVIAAIGVVAVAVTALVVLGSGLFAIDSVRVEGAAYSAGPEFDAVLDELAGSNVFRVDTDDIATRLEALPWIDDARVTTAFPDSAVVEVRERTPVAAYLGADNRYRVLDGDGRVLTLLDGRPSAYLEIFVDNPLNLDPGAVAPRGYAAGATLATMVDPLGPAVAEIHATETGSELRLTLRTVGADGQPHDIAVRLGAAEDLEAKLTRLLAKLEQLGPEVATVSNIDVSTRSNIIS